MSKKHLVIVESPAKAKTIGKYLGSEYTVKACMGHLRDLPKSTIGVDIENDFEPEYKPIRGKEEIIRELKKAAKEADTVYLATDPDREGEAISWHLQTLLELPQDKTRRVTFDEITRKVVTEAVASPRSLNKDLVDAQQARRILDRVVGYQISPVMWKKIRPQLSAGRVQSVATRMVDPAGTQSHLAHCFQSCVSSNFLLCKQALHHKKAHKTNEDLFLTLSTGRSP